MLKRRSRWLFVGPPDEALHACDCAEAVAREWVEARAASQQGSYPHEPADPRWGPLTPEWLAPVDLCVILDDTEIREAISLRVPVRHWKVRRGDHEGLRREIEGTVAGLKWLARFGEPEPS